MNPVAVKLLLIFKEMITFNESVKKELRHSKIWENFTINPSKCRILLNILIVQIYSEKP